MADRPKLGLRYGHPEPEIRAAMEVRDTAGQTPTITHPDPYWVIYRCIPKGYARAAKPPRFRHATIKAATEEACRLAQLHPESTFVILQEVAVVRMEAAS